MTGEGYRAVLCILLQAHLANCTVVLQAHLAYVCCCKHTLLQAHLNEDMPHDSAHTNKTVSMINKVMSTISRPGTFFNVQSHRCTYHNVLESPPVSAKCLCKLHHITMAMAAEPAPVELSHLSGTLPQVTPLGGVGTPQCWGRFRGGCFMSPAGGDGVG